MNKFITTILLLSTLSVHADSTSTLTLPYASTLDGDTIRSYITLPEPLNKISIRINGIDTPESTWRAKCPQERVNGILAKAYLTDYLKDTRVLYVRDFKYGKYAGRILGTVYVRKDDVLVSLAEVMTIAGFAQPYNGKKKPDWCNF